MIYKTLYGNPLDFSKIYDNVMNDEIELTYLLFSAYLSVLWSYFERFLVGSYWGNLTDDPVVPIQTLEVFIYVTDFQKRGLSNWLQHGFGCCIGLIHSSSRWSVSGTLFLLMS